MTRFDHFPKETLQFLTDLKANNDRQWFADHKYDYEAQVKAPTERFCTALAMGLQKLTQVPHSSKTYRIYRDVRFSKDKSPYNPYIHLSFSPENGGNNAPMWFFGLDSGKLALGCGVFQFDKAVLERFRADMAGPKGAALIELSTNLSAKGIRISEPELKRVPPGFDKDHPHVEALRRKGFSGWKDLNPEFAIGPDLIERTIKEFEGLLPIFRFLRS
ncbi:DUF2461 domain-containing protein [uncultured Roseobacter sp.]|uniref:DUF2461 domain-containing protein n=1 Tax=uncultured Roseobacter sp. TaxID=114847 RepID=UPI00262111FD|nr:DUF2461 domain-containing protein [uncultured Roseobacter sp.]